MIIIIYWLSFSIFLYTTINEKLNKYRPLTKGITSFCYVLIYLLFNQHFNLMMLIAVMFRLRCGVFTTTKSGTGS